MRKSDGVRQDRGQVRPAVILVVEDEVLVRMGLAMDLSDAGYTVIEAADAAEALSVLEAGHEVDLVFSDIHMPGEMDGIDLVGALQRRYPHLPVILTSANGAPPSGALAGELAFLPKPYLPTTVLDLVARKIGRRETRNGTGVA